MSTLRRPPNAEVPLTQAAGMKDRTIYAITAASLRDNITSAFGTKERAYHFAKVEGRTFAANTAR